MRKFLLAAVASVIMQMVAPAFSDAAPMVTHKYVGTVFTSSGNWAANGVNVGASVSGFFAYDLATTDGNPDANGGLYTMSQPNLFALAVGSFLFEAGDVQISVFNASFGFDQLLYHVTPPVTSGAITLSSGYVVLQDPAPSTALVSDDLPTSLSLADWDVARIWLGADVAGGSALGIEITALKTVPEPATLGLSTAGIIALAFLGLYRSRRRAD